MRILETNDWIILNHITYQLHAVKDVEKMQKTFLKQCRLLIEFDAALFFLGTSNESSRLSDAVCLDYPQDGAENYLLHLQETDYSKGLLMSGKTMIYRESDIIADEERIQTACYQQYFQKYGFHYSMNLILAMDGKLLAKISFFRKKGKPDFVYDDLFVLDMLKDHLGIRVGQSFNEIEKLHEKLTIAQCEQQFHLTAREATIVGLLMQGLDNETICRKLSITNNTLKKHILNTYKKMGLRNRTQLFKMVKEYAD